jgi:hypothetical protein
MSFTGKLNICPLGDSSRDEGVTVRIRISLKIQKNTETYNSELSLRGGTGG